MGGPQPRSWPFDRRPQARPSWLGRADDGPELALGDWARSPCDHPICKRLAWDDLSLVYDEAAVAISLLAHVLRERGDAKAVTWLPPLQTLLDEAAAAADMVHELGGRAREA